MKGYIIQGRVKFVICIKNCLVRYDVLIHHTLHNLHGFVDNLAMLGSAWLCLALLSDIEQLEETSECVKLQLCNLLQN